MSKYRDIWKKDAIHNLDYYKKIVLSIFQSAKSVFKEFDNITCFIAYENQIDFLDSTYYKMEDYLDAEVPFTDVYKFQDKPLAIYDVKDVVRRVYGEKYVGITSKHGGHKVVYFMYLKLGHGFYGGLTSSIFEESHYSPNDELYNRLDNFQQGYNVFLKSAQITETISNYDIMVLQGLIRSLEAYDDFTKNHSRNVRDLCMYFAETLNLSKDERRELYKGSLMHDIGKIYVDRSILNKNKKLNAVEYSEVKKHSGFSGDIVFSVLQDENIAEIVRSHHEWYDGSGYPDRLKGEEIHYLSRLITICDSFEAMISERPYRSMMTISKAFDELIRCREKQFDPDLVDAFVNLDVDMIKEIVDDK